MTSDTARLARAASDAMPTRMDVAESDKAIVPTAELPGRNT